MKRRRRAYAYITNNGRLLVFRHADFPEAGIQVPAGTVQLNEGLAAAAMREAQEETGLTNLEMIQCLGNREHNMTAFGTCEIQEAWFFHLRCPGTPRESWRHNETSGGTVEPIRFDFFWAQLPHGVPELIAINGAMLDELNKTLNQRPNKTSHATSEPARGAASSAHEG